jgi:hypothetical protein
MTALALRGVPLRPEVPNEEDDPEEGFPVKP